MTVGAGSGVNFEYKGEPLPWDSWATATGLPIYRGHHIEDLRTIELGWWEERQCKAAFIQLSGQEGICEGRVTEIPPGGSLPEMRFGVDELVYVLSGYGATSVSSEGRPAKSFEWQPRSMFVVPRFARRRYANLSGVAPVRLLHYSYFPLALCATPDPEMFFSPTLERPELVYQEGLYADPSQRGLSGDLGGSVEGGDSYWSGNFFPDLGVWDRLEENKGRGAGGLIVRMSFPSSELTTHMSVFPALTYKKAHRHGPGRLIVIPAGEGYSVMWREGKEKVFLPWHEGSVLVPPDRWFHQHFNVGAKPARYLALHPPRMFGGHAEAIQDRKRDQIEYPDEDAIIRERFEAELTKRGLHSEMPERAYRDREWSWKPGQKT
ncbi:MAG: cupin domain-containing protein [Chloroflexi bacterium]|nr:cupin domain-containing protein [Chloroflexota bacterium]